MKTWSAKINITASSAIIWAILTDASRYPESGPVGRSNRGDNRARGANYRLYETQPQSCVSCHSDRVCSRAPNDNGRVDCRSGLFKGVRTFTLSPQDDGSTDVAVSEDFSGPLLPLFARSLPDMTPAYLQTSLPASRRALKALRRNSYRTSRWNAHSLYNPPSRSDAHLCLLIRVSSP